MHQVYGVDMRDPAMAGARSWSWLRMRILGLLSTDSRVSRHFAPPAKGGR